jgi:serine/threonine-protein kinase
MSPEQAEGRLDELGAPSDLYSLGATAYFLLTGRQPFVYPTVGEILDAHQSEVPSPPNIYRAGVPADLQAVVMRCLEKEPSRRFQSAEELDQALAGCACAAEWDHAKAAAWWRTHDPAHSQT